MTAKFVCTKDDPWSGQEGPVVHRDAREVSDQEDGYPGGDIVFMSCPNCLHCWTMELPQ